MAGERGGVDAVRTGMIRPARLARYRFLHPHPELRCGATAGGEECHVISNHAVDGLKV